LEYSHDSSPLPNNNKIPSFLNAPIVGMNASANKKNEPILSESAGNPSVLDHLDK